MAEQSYSGMGLPPHTHLEQPNPPVTTVPRGNTIPHNHLGTTVPSGDFGSHNTSTSTRNNNGLDHEKIVGGHHHGGDTPPSELKPEGVAVEEEDVDDIDALIDDLESQDGGEQEEEEMAEVGGARPVSEELLKTDTRVGLTEQDVLLRRKKFGLNQMKEEKENLILKFLMYFVGPIQFVMEVSRSHFVSPYPVLSTLFVFLPSQISVRSSHDRVTVLAQVLPSYYRWDEPLTHMICLT